MSPARPTKASGAAVTGESRLLVTQTRSGIGTKPKHRATLRALGLRRIGQSNVLPDRPEIRGMLAVVPHLVEVEVEVEAAGDDAEAGGTAGTRTAAEKRAADGKTRGKAEA